MFSYERPSCLGSFCPFHTSECSSPKPAFCGGGPDWASKRPSCEPWCSISVLTRYGAPLILLTVSRLYAGIPFLLALIREFLQTSLMNLCILQILFSLYKPAFSRVPSATPFGDPGFCPLLPKAWRRHHVESTELAGMGSKNNARAFCGSRTEILKTGLLCGTIQHVVVI